MGVRWIMHKYDGKTIISGCGTEVSFRNNWAKNITSLQIQKKNKELYTLSVGKGRKIPLFWQEDDYEVNISLNNNIMISRKIFKNISKDVWIRLSLDLVSEDISFDIINRKIGIK